MNPLAAILALPATVNKLLDSLADKAQMEIAIYMMTIEKTAPAEKTLPTVDGDVPYSQIPRLDNGQADPEWLLANCACDEHAAARKSSSETAYGQYL